MCPGSGLSPAGAVTDPHATPAACRAPLSILDPLTQVAIASGVGSALALGVCPNRGARGRRGRTMRTVFGRASRWFRLIYNTQCFG